MEQWRISEASPTKTRGIDILTGYNKFAAHVPLSPSYMPEEQAADRARARLIAAAPDMYEALLRVAHVPCERSGNIHCTMLPADSGVRMCPFCAIRAAIAKATK